MARLQNLFSSFSQKLQTVEIQFEAYAVNNEKIIVQQFELYRKGSE